MNEDKDDQNEDVEKSSDSSSTVNDSDILLAAVDALDEKPQLEGQNESPLEIDLSQFKTQDQYLYRWAPNEADLRKAQYPWLKISGLLLIFIVSIVGIYFLWSWYGVFREDRHSLSEHTQVIADTNQEFNEDFKSKLTLIQSHKPKILEWTKTPEFVVSLQLFPGIQAQVEISLAVSSKMCSEKVIRNFQAIESIVQITVAPKEKFQLKKEVLETELKEKIAFFLDVDECPLYDLQIQKIILQGESIKNIIEDSL